MFRMMVPRCYGGLELDLDTFLEVGLTLGEADMSLAWVACFCIEHNWMLCQFPERFQRELYAGKSHILAPGVIAPTGTAPRENGGYRMTGPLAVGHGRDARLVGDRRRVRRRRAGPAARPRRTCSSSPCRSRT